MADLPLSLALTSVLGAAVDGAARPALLAATVTRPVAAVLPAAARTGRPAASGSADDAPLAPVVPLRRRGRPGRPGPDHPRAA